MIGCQGAWNLCIERTKDTLGEWEQCCEEELGTFVQRRIHASFHQTSFTVGLIKNQVEIKRPPHKVDQSFKQGLLKTMQELKMTKTDMVGGSCRQVRKRY